MERAQSANLLLEASLVATAVRARAAETAIRRDLPSDTLAAIRKANLLRVFQPRRWGGLETDPRTFFEIENIFSEACASTGWVYGVLAVQSFLIAQFDEKAQIDVWGEDPTAVACSASVPLGTAKHVQGGFRLSGHWTFSSGSSFAQWALVSAKIENRVQAPEGFGGPQLFLVSISDVIVRDTWYTFGLRGTGSNDLIIDDVFVPQYRSLQLDAGVFNLTEKERPGPALYRLPWLYLFTASISNLSIGIARAALASFAEISARRVAGVTGKIAKEDHAVHNVIGRLSAAIEAVDTSYKRDIGLLFEHISVDRKISLESAWLMRVEMSSSVRRLATLVDEMMMMLGGNGIRETSDFTRIWLDLMAARSHVGNDPTASASLLGKLMIDKIA